MHLICQWPCLYEQKQYWECCQLTLLPYQCSGTGFTLNAVSYTNNSIVNITEIRNGSAALFCNTTLPQCCYSSTGGRWFLPNGHVIHRNENLQYHTNRTQNPGTLLLHRLLGHCLTLQGCLPYLAINCSCVSTVIRYHNNKYEVATTSLVFLMITSLCKLWIALTNEEVTVPCLAWRSMPNWKVWKCHLHLFFFTQSQCLASVCLSFFTGNAAIQHTWQLFISSLYVRITVWRLILEFSVLSQHMSACLCSSVAEVITPTDCW